VAGKRGVERAVGGEEAGEAVGRGAVVVRKIAGDENLAVRLEREGAHAGVGAGGEKRGVDGAVGIEAGEIVAGDAVDGGRVEITADKHPAGRSGLDREAVGRVAGRAGIEGEVDRARGGEAGDAGTGLRIHRREISGDVEAAAEGRDDIHDGRTRAGADGVEGGVHREIREEADDAVGGETVERDKIAAEEDLAVGLESRSDDVGTGPGRGGEEIDRGDRAAGDRGDRGRAAATAAGKRHGGSGRVTRAAVGDGEAGDLAGGRVVNGRRRGGGREAAVGERDRRCRGVAGAAGRGVGEIERQIGFQAHDILRGRAAPVGEGAGDEEFAAGERDDAVDGAIGPVDAGDGRVAGTGRRDPGEAAGVGRGAADGVETTADECGAVALDGNTEDGAVDVGVEGGVVRAGGPEADEAVEGAAAVVGREGTADEPAGVGAVVGERVDRAVRSGAGDKRGVERTGGGETDEPVGDVGRAVVVSGECAADEHGAGGGAAGGAVERERADGAIETGALGERGVVGAVGVEAGDAVQAGGGDRVGREEAAEQDLAGNGVEGEARDGVVHALGRAGEKGGIEGAVGIEPADAIGGAAVVGGEGSADDELAVGGLADDGEDRAAGSAAGVEGGIEAAVGIEAGEVVAGDAVDPLEEAADDDLAVGLHEDGVDGEVDRGRERGIERAVGIVARETAVRGEAVDPDEVAGDEELVDGGGAVEGVGDDGVDVGKGVGLDVGIERRIELERAGIGRHRDGQPDQRGGGASRGVGDDHVVVVRVTLADGGEGERGSGGSRDGGGVREGVAVAPPLIGQGARPGRGHRKDSGLAGNRGHCGGRDRDGRRGGQSAARAGEHNQQSGQRTQTTKQR